MIRALAAAILLALSAQALAQQPKPGLAAWDTVRTSAEPLAHDALAAKQGWTALEKDTPAIKGDAVFSNGRLTAVVRRNGSIELYATPEGERLARELAQLQTRRFAGAMERLGPGAKEHATAFLIAMIDAGERRRVIELIGASGRRTA